MVRFSFINTHSSTIPNPSFDKEGSLESLLLDFAPFAELSLLDPYDSLHCARGIVDSNRKAPTLQGGEPATGINFLTDAPEAVQFRVT